MADYTKSLTFALAFGKSNIGDPLAQLVEHNTFNVGVLGSSPKRITKRGLRASPFFINFNDTKDNGE